MYIDLTPLNLGKESIEIVKKIEIPKEYIEKSEIIEIKNTEIIGRIYPDEINNYVLDAIVKGTMILPCSRTLKPTEYKFKIEIEEIIRENNQKFQKTIDILPIIWENILMEIPIKVINPEATTLEIKGDGWELITDSED